MRRRVDQLLDNLSNRPLSGEPLRTVGALAVLEHAGGGGVGPELLPLSAFFVRQLGNGAEAVVRAGVIRMLSQKGQRAEAGGSGRLLRLRLPSLQFRHQLLEVLAVAQDVEILVLGHVRGVLIAGGDGLV